MKTPECIHPSESLKFLDIGIMKAESYVKCLECSTILKEKEVSLK